MASVRDTWIETPAAVSSAADLEWLVGTWVAEEHGVKTESVCRWVVDRTFSGAQLHDDPSRRDERHRECS